MNLHTVMPLELVLQGMDKEHEPLLEITSAGVRMQVIVTAPGIGKIVRLLDCNLEDYLRPEFTPGTMLCFHPEGAS